MKQNAVETLLQEGLAHHQAGRLAEAEGLYRRVLAAAPAHAFANNLLGVLASQLGRHDVAEGLYRQAVKANPKTAEFHNNLGLALQEQGQRAEAEASFREAIRLNPKFPEACNNLGTALQDGGEYTEAAKLFEKALALRPDYAEAAYNAGNTHYRLGSFDAAAACFERAIGLRPRHAKALCGLGLARQCQGRAGEAEKAFRNALESDPDRAECWNGLGESCQRQGRRDEAETAFRRAISLNPDHAEAHNNLGLLLAGRGCLAEAVACYRQALRARPDFVFALNNLGIIHADMGHLEEAEACYREALAQDANFAIAHSNLGNVYRERGQMEEAARCYHEALRIDPGQSVTHNNLGTVLMAQGRLDEARIAYQRAIEIDPAYAEAHSNLIFLTDFDEHATTETQQAERRKWNDLHAAPLKPSWRPHENSRDPERRLRVGYVSADFRMHSAAYAFTPMLCHYDRERFEVYAYSNSARTDQMTGKFRNSVGAWRDIFGRSDEEAAAMIRADGIDILVDLSGHSAGNRLGVFARKPAPVQVTGWGMANGTGLEAMDYLVSDPVSIPACERRYYVEEVVDLPCQISYQCPTDAPPVEEPPMLKAGAVTFGCFNKLGKLKEDSFRLWAELLLRLPGARLMLKAAELSDPGQQDRLRRVFANLGVDPARLDLRGRTTWFEHLRQFADVDISLDPVSYSGGISTFESLWMGVPVVSLNGDAMTRRSSAAILSSLGLTAWVARSAEEYVGLALRETGEGLKLAQLRHSLRETMRSSAVCDPARYQSLLEQQYRKMWRKWAGHE